MSWLAQVIILQVVVGMGLSGVIFLIWRVLNKEEKW